MASISIPLKVLPGFKEIAEINQEEVEKLAFHLKGLSVSTNLDELVDFISVNINTQSPKEIVQTIVSFSGLLEDTKMSFEDLIIELIKSFQKSVSENLTDIKIDRLKKNLLLIFENYNALSITLKARKLLYENDNFLKEAKVTSDLRLIFNNNLKDKNRAAIIVHRLHLIYNQGNVSKDIYFTLNLEELKELKQVIERAIDKDGILKDDYNEMFKFI